MKIQLRKLKTFFKWCVGIVLFFVIFIKAVSFLIFYPYYKIEMGMDENQVIAIFGETSPLIDSASSPGLCDAKLWYGDCDAVKKSDATYFLTFKVFFDTYAIVGFKNNKVIFKGIGDA
jgi:hypothetical protein